MRKVSSLVLAGLLFVIAPAALAAQKSLKDKKPDSESQLPTITDIAGKTLDEWIKLMSSRDRSKGEKAIDTVQLFGPRAYEALPALLSELEKHTVSFPIDISIRVHGTIALGNILGSTKDPDPKHMDRGIKLLSKFLNDGQAAVRYQAVMSLGKLGPAAQAAIPALLKSLREAGTWEVRQAAAMALGSVAMDPTGKRPPHTEVVAALGTSLKDSSSAVRMSAIQSLIGLGSQSLPSHRKQLVQYLDPAVTMNDVEPSVRIWAHMAVMAISNDISEQRLGMIAKMLAHSDPLVRIQAAQALGRVGAKAQVTVPKLITVIKKDDQSDVVMSSLWALGQMETSAISAAPAIRELIKQPDTPDPMKKAAAMVLDSIEGKNEKTKDKTKDKKGKTPGGKAAAEK